MSELILTGAPDPGVLEMGILAVKGDPGVVPLDQTNTFTAVQNFAAGITIPTASLPVSVISGLSSALTSYETVAGSTARVNSAVQTLLGGASAAYDTLGEIQALLTGDESTAAALATLVGTKAPINNPTFTGTVTTPFINSAGISGTDFYLGDAGQLTLYRTGNHGAYYNLYVDGLNRFNIGTPTGSQTLISGLLASAPSLSTVPVIAKGVASQSADLQQWQNSSAAVLSRIDSGGSAYLRALYTGISSYPGSTWGVQPSGATEVGLIVRGFASQSADLQQWQLSDGTVRAKIDSGGAIYSYFGIVINNGGLQVQGGSAASFTGVLKNNNGNLVAQPNAATNVGLVVRGQASQSANIEEWQDSSSTVLSYVDSTGRVNANNLTITGTNIIMGGGTLDFRTSTATNTGAFQWSTNGGFVTSPRVATSVALVARGFTSQSANLQEWQDSTNAVLAYVNNTGAFSGTFLSSGANNLLGTTVGVGGNTTLGVVATTATRIALVVKGFTSQSADLQQWQDSSATMLAKIANDGTFISGRIQSAYFTNYSNSGPYLDMTNAASVIVQTKFASNIPLVVKGVASQSGDLTQWQDNGGTVKARVAADGSFVESGVGVSASWTGFIAGGGRARVGYYGGTPGFYVGLDDNGTAKTIQIGSVAAQGAGGLSGPMHVVMPFVAPSVTGLVLKGATSQSANLQEWQDSAGTVLAKIDTAGALGTSGLRAPLGTSTRLLVAPDNNTSIRIDTLADTRVGLMIKANSATQSSDLQQWLDSTGVVLSSVDFNGHLFLNPPGNTTHLLARSQSGFSGNYVDFQTNLGASVFKVNSGGSISLNPLTSSVFLNANNATNGQAVLLGNNSVGSTTANHTFWGASVAGNGVGPALKAVPGHAAQTGLLVQGFASQSADLQQWQNSAGTVLARFGSGGNLLMTTTINASGIDIAGGAGLNAPSNDNSTLGSYWGLVLGAQKSSTGATTGLGATVAHVIVPLLKPAVVGMIVRGAAVQTADLQEWQDSTAAVLSKVKPNGEYESAVAGNAASDAGGGTGGIVLKSPDGTRYRVTVANGGTLAVTAA